jgi:hypothetical protein
MLDSLFFSRHLDEDERLMCVTHKHWWLGIRSLFWPSVSFAASVAMIIIAFRPSLTVAFVAWACISLLWWIHAFFDYFLDAWIITDHGVIDVAWHGWFHRQSTRVLYSDIQGVSYEVQGILGTLLRFGTVSVEKISTGSVISLDHVGNPRAVEARILKNMEAYLYSKNLKDAKHVQELLSHLVAEHVQAKSLERR